MDSTLETQTLTAQKLTHAQTHKNVHTHKHTQKYRLRPMMKHLNIKWTQLIYKQVIRMSHITEGASFQKKNKKNSFRPRTPSTQKNLYELIFLLIFLF